VTYAIDDLAELKEYLGDDYDQGRMERWDSAIEEEFEQLGDEAALYRTSQAYLYDLTVFAMSGIKLPYLSLLRRHVPSGGRILDYGCGIGADGLRLLEDGYDVAFADFDNPSTQFLRWRLERRGLQAPVYDIERDEIPAGFDATFAFDVIEHVDDPFAFVGRMESLARLVAVNLLESLPEEAENPLHRDLPITELLARAAARAPFAYERHHKRSHLVIYGPGAAPAPVRALRLARLRAERLLAKPRGRAAQVS
jgi:SAM-dependent methyltransferase